MVSPSIRGLLIDISTVFGKKKVTRHQLPIQPAFAVTGHSAQGKTLPNVLIDLADTVDLLPM